MPDCNALALTHRFLKEHVRPGSLCIDATAGRGRDTEFLCTLVGSTGHVLTFDIQPEAVESTRARLEECGLSDRAEIFLESHSRLSLHARPGTVQAIVFNFGWLPGGDHTIFTRPETSIAALRQGLSLLAPDGVMTLCLYYGKENGFSERDALLDWLRQVDSRQYTVLVHEFINRPNCPPIAVLIWREH